MQVRTASAIGAAIRSRRRELQLDQGRLARKIGATRQWLIAIEKGKDTAELGMVLRALAALDLELNVQPNQARGATPLDIQPLPRLDIDSIANANLNRHSALAKLKRSRGHTKTASRRASKSKQRG
jgi:HTH-type transcriptional regulator / antitoxin HipB